MNEYTLSIIFNKSCDKVLMCWHTKQQAYNFIGGKICPGELDKEASYREVFEETGITREDITLCFLREERVIVNKLLYKDDWRMYITYGVLKRDIVELKEGENRLVWVCLNDKCIDTDSMGYGNCRVFLNEALEILNRECVL